MDERHQLNLLMYLETGQVDYGGRVQGCRMNEEEFDLLTKWNDEKYIRFGRLPAKLIMAAKTRFPFTHWVRLSEKAWADAHCERKARALRNVKTEDAPFGTDVLSEEKNQDAKRKRRKL